MCMSRRKKELTNSDKLNLEIKTARDVKHCLDMVTVWNTAGVDTNNFLLEWNGRTYEIAVRLYAEDSLKTCIGKWL